MKRFLFLLLISLSVMVIAACGSGNDTTGAENEKDDKGQVQDNSDLIEEGIGTDFGFGPVGHDLQELVERMGNQAKNARIGISVNTQSDDWSAEWVNALKTMCEENGIECIVTDAQKKPEKQVEDLRSLQNQGVDGIVIFPQEEKPLVQILSQLEGEIPVVPAIPIEGAKVPAYVDVNQQNKGELAAIALEEEFEEEGKDGKVLILDIAGKADFAAHRIEGFEDYVENESSNLEIIDVQPYKTSEEYLSATKNIVASNEDVNAIFAVFGAPTVAAAQALKEMNRKDIKIVGVDGDLPLLKLLEDGWITGTNPQSPQQNGSIALFTLLRIINGEEVESPVWEPEEYASLWATPKNATEVSEKIWGEKPKKE